MIVFFVISGFCIHLPYRGDVKLEVGRYYLRRYTRILIPVAGALCAYLFYLAVERPSHRFARWIGKRRGVAVVASATTIPAAVTASGISVT